MQPYAHVSKFKDGFQLEDVYVSGMASAQYHMTYGSAVGNDMCYMMCMAFKKDSMNLNLGSCCR